MQALKLILTPQTAFGTPLVGDTLFGQICWAIVEQYGEAVLDACLQDYCAPENGAGKPFLVVSDAFPEGYLPLPTLPSAYWRQGDESDRKKLKKRQWLPESALAQDSREWQKLAKSSTDIAEQLQQSRTQSHNSINRQTGTTGEEGFAPYDSEQIWYAVNSRWQIFLLLDESRLTRVQLQQVLENIGRSGYGRDASVGLGKYEVQSLESADIFSRTGNACFALAPSCPQGLGYERRHSYYNTLTRFGRHGNVHATSGQPFKNPVLMAQTGAVFCGQKPGDIHAGQGISGISSSLTHAVHQGYAPAIAFTLDTAALDTTRSNA